MSMIDHSTTTIENREELQAIAKNIVMSLSGKTGVTILLSGELGAGKTTLVQEIGKAMGITEHITSPSYALLQEYQQGTLTHIDLYRLTPQQSASILDQRDLASRVTIIEWPEKAGTPIEHDIHISLHPKQDGKIRTIEAIFRDAAIPSDREIEEWQRDVRLPQHIINHCKAVRNIAENIADHCERHGMIVRKKAVSAAALLHDLLRFVDFTHNGNPEKNAEQSEDDRTFWAEMTAHYPPPHEHAIGIWLREKGYPLIAQIAEAHRGDKADTLPYSLEQMIVAYADKRLIGETVVSIEDRFRDLSMRYRGGQETDASLAWKASIQTIEQRLQMEHSSL